MTDKEFLQRIGLELRLARIRCNLSGHELAALCGLGGRAVYRIENGQNNLHVLTLVRMCETLGIQISSVIPELSLYNGEENKQGQSKG